MEALNPMNHEPVVSVGVIEAYPQLTAENMKYIGRFTPEVPISPDRIYDVYGDAESNSYITHVTTDYPDPLHDAAEFANISGGYGFKQLIVPSIEGGTIAIVNNDDISEEFFVKDASIYHYVAIAEYNPHKV